MEIVILSAVASVSYLILTVKIIGIRRTVDWSKWLDLLFTVSIPVIVATTGTFSAVVLAILSGFFYSVLTTLLKALTSIKAIL